MEGQRGEKGELVSRGRFVTHGLSCVMMDYVVQVEWGLRGREGVGGNALRAHKRGVRTRKRGSSVLPRGVTI